MYEKRRNLGRLGQPNRMGTLALILSERGAHAIFQTVNITVVLMVAGDRVIQRVPRELTWVTKDYLT